MGRSLSGKGTMEVSGAASTGQHPPVVLRYVYPGVTPKNGRVVTLPVAWSPTGGGGGEGGGGGSGGEGEGEGEGEGGGGGGGFNTTLSGRDVAGRLLRTSTRPTLNLLLLLCVCSSIPTPGEPCVFRSRSIARSQRP